MRVIDVFDPQACDSCIMRVSWQVYIYKKVGLTLYSFSFRYLENKKKKNTRTPLYILENPR